ncbi:4598_t:CDS:2 [Entrophospora sp. SA101]|nr:4598_t:CDS:2 [Entrophospora sp. SA101]
MSKEIHEYFSHAYIKSLNNIIALEKGKRCERALTLLEKYKENLSLDNYMIIFPLVKNIGGVVGTFLVLYHSRLFVEPRNQCRGTSDLLGCLMFKASCRPRIGPIRAQERNRTSRNETLINFYGDYENNGTISTGDYATNIQHIKRKSSTLEIEEKNRQKKVESYAESTISSTETKTDFDSDYMKTHKKASN